MAISPQIVLFVFLMLAVVQATKLDEKRLRRRARKQRDADLHLGADRPVASDGI